MEEKKRSSKGIRCLITNLTYIYLLDGAYGPFGCAKLPYDSAWQGSPLPDTTAISSSSCPGDELLPDTKRVDDVPPVL